MSKLYSMSCSTVYDEPLLRITVSGFMRSYVGILRTKIKLAHLNVQNPV
jgi:hypothetical protein